MDASPFSVIQRSVSPGSGRFSMVGMTSKGIRESGRMAYDYLRTTGKKIGVERDHGEYDINIQVMSLAEGKDASDLGPSTSRSSPRRLAGPSAANLSSWAK